MKVRDIILIDGTYWEIMSITSDDRVFLADWETWDEEKWITKRELEKLIKGRKYD